MVRTRITEGDIVKADFTLPVGFALRLLRLVGNDRLRMNYLVDTVCRNAGTGQENRNHGHHHKGHDNHHGIGNKCHHINALAAKPDNRNRHGVHGQHHGRHHKVHHPVGKQLGTHQVRIGTGKPFFLPLLPAEGTNRHDTGEDFTADEVHPVNQ